MKNNNHFNPYAPFAVFSVMGAFFGLLRRDSRPGDDVALPALLNLTAGIFYPTLHLGEMYVFRLITRGRAVS